MLIRVLIFIILVRSLHLVNKEQLAKVPSKTEITLCIYDNIIFSYKLLVNKERLLYFCLLIIILLIELFSYLNIAQ